MRIHIIGPGAVGKATGEGFRRFGHEIVYTDKGDTHALVAADVRFICTPEEAVEVVVKELRVGYMSYIPIVIRSSVVPGTTRNLVERCGDNICHNPEFLREGVAEFEFLDADWTLLGIARNDHGNVWWTAKELYEGMGKRVIQCSSTESELVKLAVNGYLSALISYWRSVGELARRLGVNGHRVSRLALNDPRVSRYGAVQFGKFGGRCLPKDLNRLIDLMTVNGGPADLLLAARKINEEDIELE